MSAPHSGPTSRKFTNSDVLRCFDEENRRHVGKIELSSKEITGIMNERVLDEQEVTRQAVKNRLDDMVGDKLVKNEHGRSHLYARSDDIDRLFREPEPVTTPAGGGSGGNGRQPTKRTGGLFSRLFGPKDREMWLPGVVIAVFIGFVGYHAFKATYSRIQDIDSDVKGAAWLTFTAAMTIALSGFLAYSILRAVTAAQSGFLLLGLSWLIGVGTVVATLSYAGGIIGFSAQVAEIPFRGDSDA